MVRRRSLLLLCLLVIWAARADAATILFATLTNNQEVPPAVPTLSTGAPRPASFGTATFVLNDAQTELSMFATVFNIDITGTQTPDTNDNLVAAHIHVGALPGANAPVRWGFFGLPDNDINPDNLVVTPFVGGVGGTFSSIWNAPEGNAGTTLATNLPLILAGLSYLNFHTVQFGGGEIRGQIVPEPATLLMLGSGLAAALMRRRSRRN
jgi:hypothetical protein